MSGDARRVSGADEPSRRPRLRGPSCATCRVNACLAPPEAAGAPGAQKPPAFCPMVTDPELLEWTAETCRSDQELLRMAQESARTEAAGYCVATRVEETMDFARRMGWRRLGLAHCIGLSREAATARDIFSAHGFEVTTVCCKAGSIPKEDIGLSDADKVRPGTYEVMCNPLGQAALLAKAGTELNVLIGLCVGHDSLFFLHSHAPVTVLVVKDRVLGHNPVAALYGTHMYYRRLAERQPEP